MLVIAIPFGEGLLEDGSPKCTSFFDRCKQSVIFSIVAFYNRDGIVYHDSHGEAEHVQIHSVQAIGTLFILVIQEQFLNASWCLSDGSNSANKPVIADPCVLHVLNFDSILAEKRLFSIIFARSLPIDTLSRLDDRHFAV